MTLNPLTALPVLPLSFGLSFLPEHIHRASFPLRPGQVPLGQAQVPLGDSVGGVTQKAPHCLQVRSVLEVGSGGGVPEQVGVKSANLASLFEEAHDGAQGAVSQGSSV